MRRHYGLAVDVSDPLIPEELLGLDSTLSDPLGPDEFEKRAQNATLKELEAQSSFYNNHNKVSSKYSASLQHIIFTIDHKEVDFVLMIPDGWPIESTESATLFKVPSGWDPSTGKVTESSEKPSAQEEESFLSITLNHLEHGEVLRKLSPQGIFDYFRDLCIQDGWKEDEPFPSDTTEDNREYILIPLRKDEAKQSLEHLLVLPLKEIPGYWIEAYFSIEEKKYEKYQSIFELIIYSMEIRVSEKYA